MNIPWPQILIALGTVLAVIGAFWSALEQNDYDKNLQLLTKENASLNQTLLDQVTGGDTFPFIHYTPSGLHDSNPNTLDGLHELVGRMNLYDVSFSQKAVPSEKLDIEGLTANDVMIYNKSLQLPITKTGTFITGRIYPISSIKLPVDKKYFTVEIEISARNGIFIQTTKLSKVGGFWKVVSYKISREVSYNKFELIKKYEE